MEEIRRKNHENCYLKEVKANVEGIKQNRNITRAKAAEMLADLHINCTEAGGSSDTLEYIKNEMYRRSIVIFTHHEKDLSMYHYHPPGNGVKVYGLVREIRAATSSSKMLQVDVLRVHPHGPNSLTKVNQESFDFDETHDSKIKQGLKIKLDLYIQPLTRQNNIFKHVVYYVVLPFELPHAIYFTTEQPWPDIEKKMNRIVPIDHAGTSSDLAKSVI